MTKQYMKLFYRRPMTWVVLFLLVGFRMIQYFTLEPIGNDPLSFFSMYNTLFQFGLFFLPVFCFWIYHEVFFFCNHDVLMRYKSFSKWMLQFSKTSILLALQYVFLTQFFVVIDIATRSDILLLWDYLLATFLLQLLLYVSCAFLFFLCYLLFGKVYLGLVFVLLYSSIDLMPLTVSFPIKISIALAIFNPNEVGLYEAFSHFAMLVSSIAVFYLACVWICKIRDFHGEVISHES